MVDTLENCAKFFTHLKTFDNMNKTLLTYVKSVFSDDSTQTALTNITTKSSIDMSGCDVKASGETLRALQAINNNSDDDKKESAPKIKHDNWDWWTNEDNNVPVSYNSDKTDKCLNSEGMKNFLKTMFFKDDIALLQNDSA